MFAFIVLLVVAYHAVVDAQGSTGTLMTEGVPDGYILQITPSCGADGSADASIDIVTDLNADAKAYCDGAEVNFTSTDGVNFALGVGYPGAGSSETCIFYQRNNSEVFAIKVVVSYGEVGRFVHNHQLEYTVSCTFDPKATDASGSQNIVVGLIAPQEIQTNVGADSSFTFELEMVDVLENSLAGEDVPLGKTVLLRAETGGAGVRPVSCDAIDGTNRYAILRAGCGDGIVFEKDEGFTTTANVTLSPYFKAFSINTAVVLSFECNFVECPSGTPCDGSSCTSAR